MGAAQEFLDDDEFDALFQEEGRGRVAEIVEPDGQQLRVVEWGAEVRCERGGFYRVHVRPCEDVAAVLPSRARLLLLACLPPAVP